MTDDEFLYRYRQSPRPEFAGSLYQQLQQVKPAKSSFRRRAFQFVKAAAAISVLMIAILAVSPEARAYVSKVIRETIEYLQFGNVMLRVVPDMNSSPGQGGVLADNETVPVADAQKILPFKLPSWLPNNWQPVDVAIITRYDGDDEIIISLYYPEKPSEYARVPLILGILNKAQPQVVVGDGHHARLVDINGQKGTLYTGAWTAGTFGGESKNLVWTLDNLTYFMTGTELSDEDLIRIAESVK
jgi:hypothetical protein